MLEVRLAALRKNGKLIVLNIHAGISCIVCFFVLILISWNACNDLIISVYNRIGFLGLLQPKNIK